MIYNSLPLVTTATICLLAAVFGVQVMTTALLLTWTTPIRSCNKHHSTGCSTTACNSNACACHITVCCCVWRAGDDYGPAPDLDHANEELQQAPQHWLQYNSM
jgi:hypothetical protein